MLLLAAIVFQLSQIKWTSLIRGSCQIQVFGSLKYFLREAGEPVVLIV